VNDLETRLSAAGRSLRESAERTADLDAGWTDLTARLAADGDGTVVVRADDRFDHPPVQRQRWLAAAAAMLVIVGAAATFVALTDTTDDGVATPPTPAEPLFLLPAADKGYRVSGGFVQPATDDASPASSEPLSGRLEVAVLGVPDGDGYTDLVTVTVIPWGGPPEALGPYEPREIDTAVGPATLRSIEALADTVVQQRGDLGLTVEAASGAADLAVAVLEATTIVDGRPVVSDAPRGLVEIDRSSVPASDVVRHVTSFDVDADADLLAPDDGAVSVETAVWPVSLLAVAASMVDQVTPISIGGEDGWLATRDDGDSFGLVWRAPTGHLVAVSGSHTVEDLLRVAESLVPAEEDAWRTATGAGLAPTAGTQP
jgi:hypothetical protein